MEVKIITRHAIANFGSILQSIATSSYFEAKGYNTQIIDYISKDEMPFRNTLNFLKNNKKWNSNIFKKIIYFVLKYPEQILLYHYYNGIRKKLLKLTRRYNSTKKLERANFGECILCAGSDQLWGPMPNGKLDYNYFLRFNSSLPKISFSSSIGRLSSSIDDVKDDLKAFSLITTREESAAKKINELIGDKAFSILDPTFMIGSEFWKKEISNYKRIVNEKYILVYKLHSNSDFDKYINSFSIKTGIKVVYVSPSLSTIMEKGKKYCLIHPYKFLSLIRDAEFVLTDSFHGTCFSLLFNKQFFSFLPKVTSTRIKELLKCVGLEFRIINNDNYDEKSYIDYIDVDKKLNNLINKYDELYVNELQNNCNKYFDLNN